ncbi:hypothetical protein yc1106_08666 [Curvularia clavata]|uniref:Uncharacterized protein n=1 Tax=Curvularia clavata TaxID=95742 RepID=A0A9Q8ZG70_CURCL|nr:hypothetical protein yc1106_08666 [Curvularia clavata]
MGLYEKRQDDWAGRLILYNMAGTDNFEEPYDSSFKTPSDLTLQLENGHVKHVPPRLKKTTPNFHLIMPSERDSNGFCKATLSAMVLNYPPPTVVQLHSGHGSSEKRQEAILSDTLHYLSNQKLVKDQDLVLIVDAQETRFQLPGDVIIAQYKQLLVDGNTRLLKRYGTDENGAQKFNQTIIFGAEKLCEGDDMACKYVPLSIFPDDMYGAEAGRRISETPAKFLNARTVMGPAGDLRTLYEAALKKFQERKSQSQTIQSVMATLFAEQQLNRDAFEVKTKSSSAKLKDLFRGRLSDSLAKNRLYRAKASLSNFTTLDFSIGLDYTHTLFQPLSYTTPDEIIPLMHTESINLTQYTHHSPDTIYLSLPAALSTAKPPFSRPDFTAPNPSPNQKPSHMENLEYKLHLDALPDRTVQWPSIPLIQNTYTGAIPAVLSFPPTAPDNTSPSANISEADLWYSPYKRALLRNVFRNRQSPKGYHDAAVGGDREWDRRGGLGGVWMAGEGTWVPWGQQEEDGSGGVCGGERDMEVFGDGKGVWMKEGEGDGGKKRGEGEEIVQRRKKRWELERENFEIVVA